MKEIKFLLFTLYIAGYTSLIWASFIWGGIPVGPNNIQIGWLFSFVFTFVHFMLAIAYLKDNWNE